MPEDPRRSPSTWTQRGVLADRAAVPTAGGVRRLRHLAAAAVQPAQPARHAVADDHRPRRHGHPHLHPADAQLLRHRAGRAARSRPSSKAPAKWRVLTGVALPISLPALAVLGTLQFTWIWNDFLWPLIFTQSDDKRTIMLGIVSLRGQYTVAWGRPGRPLPAGQPADPAGVPVLPALLHRRHDHGRRQRLTHGRPQRACRRRGSIQRRRAGLTQG